MSGTSLDGIDLACINFVKKESWSYQFKATQTIEYSQNWIKKLKELVYSPKENIESAEKSYSLYLSRKINNFILKNNFTNIDAICSHGHTIFHEPQKGITYQLGNKKILATYTGLKVVCDFRVQDVALGGQGAPLVPIGDKLLFRNYDSCLNLGGFANVSQNINGVFRAYDICAVNTVLNKLSNRKGKLFDFEGGLAKNGKFISPFFQILESLEYYSKKAPKSLGIEWVNSIILPKLKKFENHSVEDLLNTYTIHIAKQIGGKFKKGNKVLVTGGGVKNKYLMKQIKNNSLASFEVPSDELIDFKEALIFGLLGVLRLRNEINCLASITGCSYDHSSGFIYTP